MIRFNKRGDRRGTTTRHGEALRGKQSAEYRTWCEIIRRCRNKKSPGFKNYGGRGITICSRWNRFENFIKDMGRKPTSEHSIDRKDNEKGYTPANCRWATRKEQNSNRRSCVFVPIGSQRFTVVEAAKITGIKSRTIYGRIKRGMTPVQAIEEYLTKETI